MKYSEYFGAKRRLSLKNENIRFDTVIIHEYSPKVKCLVCGRPFQPGAYPIEAPFRFCYLGSGFWPDPQTLD